MYIDIGSIRYSSKCTSRNREIQGGAQLSKVSVGAGSTFTFTLFGYPPFIDARPSLTKVFTESGKQIFLGYFRGYSINYTSSGPVTTMNFDDAGRHLRRRPVFGHYSGTLEMLLGLFIDMAGASWIFSPVTFLTGSISIGLDDFLVKDAPIDIYLQGEYLDEILNKLVVRVNCGWRISAELGNIIIFQAGFQGSNIFKTFNINELIFGCPNLNDVPESLSYGYTINALDQIEVWGRNGRLTLGESIENRLDIIAKDIPKDSVQTVYDMIPEIATEVIQAKIVAFDIIPPGEACDTVSFTIISITPNLELSVFEPKFLILSFGFLATQSGSKTVNAQFSIDLTDPGLMNRHIALEYQLSATVLRGTETLPIGPAGSADCTLTTPAGSLSVSASGIPPQQDYKVSTGFFAGTLPPINLDPFRGSVITIDYTGHAVGPNSNTEAVCTNNQLMLTCVPIISNPCELLVFSLFSSTGFDVLNVVGKDANGFIVGGNTPGNLVDKFATATITIDLTDSNLIGHTITLDYSLGAALFADPTQPPSVPFVPSSASSQLIITGNVTGTQIISISFNDTQATSLPFFAGISTTGFPFGTETPINLSPNIGSIVQLTIFLNEQQAGTASIVLRLNCT